MESASVARRAGKWAVNVSLLEKGRVITSSGLKNLAALSGKHTFTFLKLHGVSVTTAGCQYFTTE